MSTLDNSQAIEFCTLGMFIIDEIYPHSTAEDQTPQLNIIGGAGTYSAIGARLLSPGPTSRSVGWIVDAGSDFPASARDTIESWQTSVLIRKRDAPTTRGWNGYGANDHRAFRYLTEKKRITADDLPDSSAAASLSESSLSPSSPGGVSDVLPDLLHSRSFHLICNATRCVELVQRIHQRLGNDDDATRPMMIWEPVPDLCVPAELENTFSALQHVDVISPNHEELGALFGFEHPESGEVQRDVVEEQASELLNRGIGQSGSGAVVVRAGKEGCYVASRRVRAWLPAYHYDAAAVIDPTGGGNGFLGGLAVGLARTDGDLMEAARWGSVAASFCIEQVGMPRLERIEGQERWNGQDVMERLKSFRERTVNA